MWTNRRFDAAPDFLNMSFASYVIRDIFLTRIPRCTIPEEFPDHSQDDPQTTIPRLRSHLSPAFPASHPAGRGGTSQHILQAFHLLCATVQLGGQARTGSLARTH